MGPSTDNEGPVRYHLGYVHVDVGRSISTDTNSVWVWGLSPSYTYRFAVAAVDRAGNSTSGTGTLTITMPPGDDEPPTAPASLTASDVTADGVTLSFPRPTDNVLLGSYEIHRVTAGGTELYARLPWHPVHGPTITQRLTGLSPGTHTLAVRAVDAAGNISGFSPSVTVTIPGPAPACEVRYRVVDQWAGGFSASVTLRNNTPALVDGWTLTWNFVAGQQIGTVWDAVRLPEQSPSGVRNARWNAQLAPGATVTFGFIGSWSGGNPPPTAFALNGHACTT
ncbi:MAG TPA: cellulose binding domain-containing protein [Pilimelia sp.]|nr:cellulose binding domain-containing protein [Pilimelia sp.]